MTDENNTDADAKVCANEYPIVFYDGECALCNSFVQLVIVRDRSRQFRFAPLQGETARQTIGTPIGDPVQWTVILLDDNRTYDRSDAALRIMQRLGGVWRITGVFRILPRPLRDAIYRFIARRRFRWFGRVGSCRIPTEDERTQLLP